MVILAMAAAAIIVFLLFRAVHGRASTSGARTSGPDIARRDALIIRELRERQPLTVQQIVAQLDARKVTFLDEVEEAVRGYIAAQGPACMTIVERWSDGSVYRTWEISPTPGYVGHLIKFLRGETADGHALDSGLTDPVMAVVTSKFRQLHFDTGEVIAGELLRSDHVAECLADNIVLAHTVQYLSKRVRAKAADLVVHHVRLVIEHQTGISATAVAALAAQVALLLYQHFGSAVTGLLVEALKSSAVQHAVLVVGKKYLLLAVLPAAVKALLAKVGVTVTVHGVHAAATLVLIPVVAAFIARDIYHFPRELGEKVAKQVRDTLDGQYAQTNHRIAASLYEGVVETLANTGVDEFVRSLVHSSEVEGQIADLCASLAETRLAEVG